MPIKIQNDLPAKHELEEENIFVMDESRALSQDFRELQIAILNLMPLKQDTELQLLRALSNTPLQIDVTFIQTESHISKNTSHSHIKKFYETFTDIKDKNFDGLIITGAPVEKLDFEEVNYWDELTNIMEWSKKHVHCTLYMCWAAFASLYYHYGIERVDREEKLSGVYKHRVLKKSSPLFRGFDDIFDCPQSRAMTVNREDVEKIPELEVLAVSDAAGVAVIKTEDSRQFFMTGHLEYDSDTLAKEYFRDLDKGMNPSIPANYFPDDNPEKKPVV
ncbi:MAG: homoserine O-succinyltransferase, partial [Lachnospira sp.]|nr:homoserine O-succinyltransferase [Lachnospira sp.]